MEPLGLRPDGAISQSSHLKASTLRPACMQKSSFEASSVLHFAKSPPPETNFIFYCAHTHQPVLVFSRVFFNLVKRNASHWRQLFRFWGLFCCLTMLCFPLQEPCSAARACYSNLKSESLTKWKCLNIPLKSNGSTSDRTANGVVSKF